jgi:hypothetical protein
MKKNLLFLILCMALLISNICFAKEEKTDILVDQDIEQEQQIQEQNFSQKEQISASQAKGMHLTTFASASQFYKTRINDLLDNTEMNAVVIDIKEIDGAISIKNISGNITYSKYIPNVKQYLKEVKDKGMYAIARIVVFRDNVMPRKKPELAVKNPDGSLWEDRNKITWLNPYKQEAIDYILELAEKTADMGFDEIQFDYIRFPSDGKIGDCRYGVEYSSITNSNAITNFLKQAKQRLAPKGKKISIDVFGLTTTEKSDMGIGQKIAEMIKYVDYVSPMIYPSHYNNGEYGIANPNKEPYRTVYIALQGAKKRFPAEKLRPWLQDFSLKGVKYGPAEIKAQIQACYDCGITTWLLWNASCKYTKDGLKSKADQYSYTKTPDEKIKELLKYQDVNDSIQKRAKPIKKVNSVKKSTSTVIKSSSTKTTATVKKKKQTVQKKLN